MREAELDGINGASWFRLKWPVQQECSIVAEWVCPSYLRFHCLPFADVLHKNFMSLAFSNYSCGWHLWSILLEQLRNYHATRNASSNNRLSLVFYLGKPKTYWQLNSHWAIGFEREPPRLKIQYCVWGCRSGSCDVDSGLIFPGYMRDRDFEDCIKSSWIRNWR